MLIHELFEGDVTRDIPPVVYFHEQTPAKVADEISEYIITGGWPDGHPNHRRVPNGIHEQYVHLLRAMAQELDKPGGPALPAAWISGFYGSGKSSFAKLLGLALDGMALPDGNSVAEALLRRDVSPRSDELREAWHELRRRVDPIAVVFDIGAVGRDNEHIHSATVRQVQRRLGYCTIDPLVADAELKLERRGEWAQFLQLAEATLGEPWHAVKDQPMAEELFSEVMHAMEPTRYVDPMAWYAARAGTHVRSESPEEAVKAIRDMLAHRRPSATIFLVVDEVSQYVLSSQDRVERLRAFAETLGARLRGKAWLLALGQQKLEEDADASFLVKTKDRFPPRLRVHLAATNIRDVVHRRLLHKNATAHAALRTLFDRHRADLKLFAYGCEAITPEEFVEVYPLLPGHIDLLLQITSALRTRSTRAQGDDQAIRGLLQLLGELFRDQGLADQEVGALITLDQIYEVQHTALDSDVQASMARILNQCVDDATGLLTRVAKAVALLELIQDTIATDARLVARCLYDRLDRGNQVSEITDALEELRRRTLLGYSEKHGYKIQSSAGEEWDRDRRDIGVAREIIGEIVQGALTSLLEIPDRPKYQGRPFPWAGNFSDGRRYDDAILKDPRDDAALRVDFRFLATDERTQSTWVRRSDETALRNRLVWVCGDTDQVDARARELARSRAMVRKYKPRRESLNAARKMLLQQEENRLEDLEKRVRDDIAAAWMSGRVYFRGRPSTPTDLGASFATALSACATRALPDLFPHFVATQVAPSELMQLLEMELSGPSPKFLTTDLGILELDSGRYVPACSGVVPHRIQEHIEAEGGLGGTTLLAYFGAPPYGYTPNVVKACVAGLLRAGRLRLQPEAGDEITAVRDAGVREVFDKDRAFRRATLFPSEEDDIGFQARAKICKFFEKHLGHRLDREDHAIADAVQQRFPEQVDRLRSVLTRLNRLPDSPQAPPALRRLHDVMEQCVRACRQTRPTVKLVKRHLDALRDGVQLLSLYDAELTAAALAAVGDAANVYRYQAKQLADVGALDSETNEAVDQIEAHLGTERPWQAVQTLEEPVARIRASYAAERRRQLQWQEQQAEAARAAVKSRQGFSTLTADQSHKVLRPITVALTATSEDAVAPTLEDLRDPFLARLQRAVDAANEKLDEFLVDVVTVNLRLKHREIKDEAALETLVGEIRDRVKAQLAQNKRVRLL